MNKGGLKFSLKEGAVLGVFLVLLLGVLYYYFVDQPVKRGLADADTETMELQLELTSVQVKLNQLQKMQEEVNQVSTGNAVSSMPSYNSVKAEIQLLNDIMASATEYSVSFSDVTVKGNQVRRDVALSFTAPDYNTAVSMLTRLANSSYRCKISAVECASAENIGMKEGAVKVAATATFYETMVGGAEDAGLPAEAVETTKEEADTIDSYLDSQNS